MSEIDYRRGDIGPVSSFVQKMKPLKLILGHCPLCQAPHFFVFVTGNHPEKGQDANTFLVEPFFDSSRPPK